MAEGLAHELMDASNNTGASEKKKEDTHKMAQKKNLTRLHTTGGNLR